MATNKIIIIGGGIIGMSCAAELSRRGASVTVIDTGKIGHGCSYGNAGWITPCFAMPLPMPGMLMKSIQWLLDPEGPLYIKPTPSLLLFQWMTRFLFSMNEKQARKSIENLVALSKVSFHEYKKLSQKYPEKTHFKQKGLLMVAQSAQGLDLVLDEMNRMSELNILGKKLSSDELKAQEPALTGRLSGGVFFPEEAHAEPLGIVESLKLEALSYGTQIIESCEFIEATIENQKISSIMTTQGILSAENFVLATGSWSKDLAQKLQINVPILGGKGYAMISPPLENQPHHPIMLTEKKIAITPRQNSLRIAGTLELVDQDFSITQRRVQAILKGAKEFLPLPEKIEIQELWRGLRPCTPDGVPMIGWNKNIKNLMLACGHQMLGLQSGTGTGLLVADLIEGKSPVISPEAFDPMRFS